ncbi:oligopeptide/dipeptide ABC transporter ATP-binding protein [Aestuariicoccus sp. MJ-SS9]|uniref:ABC transporter ATP-binding protein n=1 Tax=Aestuariicoccus sp. MJ-SS9 TaxID=3079855 RepID=UPI0029110017|nr:oligopeptide/dipeptide ABC transporter ATP-binding protein [Aestuariicoccus sp. MJ-SS9]MDU8913405.1 ATP-binding cassette domain-containing protein [Aestuariicoccus sp. MJ-SS9]
MTALLAAQAASKTFITDKGRKLHAVSHVDVELAAGETLAIVGESGCGKSTLARLLIRLDEPTSGQIEFEGADVTHAPEGKLRGFRQSVAMVFQDPYASINPRLTARSIVREPLDNFRRGTMAERNERVNWLLSRVGLGPQHASRFPHELSGGQRQRLALSRALALRPKVVIADEPVSALDVSIQAQVLNLLRELQAEMGLGLIFVSHDISVVEHISQRIAVMYLGRIVETGSTESILSKPSHPYTHALLDSVPRFTPVRRHRRELIKGETPSPFDLPSGCAFRARCPNAQELCARTRPELSATRAGLVACHFPLEGTSLNQEPRTNLNGGPNDISDFS